MNKILSLKELFRSHPGKSPIQIHFTRQSKEIGKIAIDAQWGVEATEELKKKIAKILL